MSKKHICLVLLAVLVSLTACKTSQGTTASYHSYPTECISQNVDGKMLLRVWATGEFSKDAIREAEKKALDDVIFKGITMGVSNRSQIALLVEGNARQKYEDYFLRFFADGGDYKNYVSRDKSHINAVERTKNKGTKSRGIIVLVDVPALKARLKQDGII